MVVKLEPAFRTYRTIPIYLKAGLWKTTAMVAGVGMIILGAANYNLYGESYPALSAFFRSSDSSDQEQEPTQNTKPPKLNNYDPERFRLKDTLDRTALNFGRGPVDVYSGKEGFELLLMTLDDQHPVMNKPQATKTETITHLAIDNSLQERITALDFYVGLQRQLKPELASYPDFNVQWFLASNEIESHFDNSAISPTGARGPLQLQPTSALEDLVELADLNIVKMPEETLRSLKLAKKQAYEKLISISKIKDKKQKISARLCYENQVNERMVSIGVDLHRNDWNYLLGTNRKANGFIKNNGNSDLANAAFYAGQGAIRKAGGIPQSKGIRDYLGKHDAAYAKYSGQNFRLGSIYDFNPALSIDAPFRYVGKKQVRIDGKKRIMDVFEHNVQLGEWGWAIARLFNSWSQQQPDMYICPNVKSVFDDKSQPVSDLLKPDTKVYIAAEPAIVNKGA